MKRREFITLLGAAVALPLAARAQESERVRRIAVLIPGTADDAEYQARMVAFLQGLQQLGWSDGRNVRIDIRYAAGDANLTPKYAAELIAFAPDVILAPGSTTVGPLLQATRTVPIVSRLSSIRSVAAWLIAWRGRAATPPASSRSNTALAGNGSNCSSRSRQA